MFVIYVIEKKRILKALMFSWIPTSTTRVNSFIQQQQERQKKKSKNIWNNGYYQKSTGK